MLSTVDAPDDTPAPPLPTAEWIVLPSASTSAAPTTDGEAPENAGEKRKAATDAEEPAKKSKGAAADGHRIHTVLHVEDFTGPPTPSVQDIESAILARQKGAPPLDLFIIVCSRQG